MPYFDTYVYDSFTDDPHYSSAINRLLNANTLTYDLVLDAVREDGWALKYAGEFGEYKEIVLAALENCPEIYDELDEHWQKDEDVLKVASAHNILNTNNINSENRLVNKMDKIKALVSEYEKLEEEQKLEKPINHIK